MTPATIQRKLRRDPGFISSRRYRNRLARLEARYPEECPDHIIAQVLELTVEELEAEYALILAKLRRLMGVRDGS